MAKSASVLPQLLEPFHGRKFKKFMKKKELPHHSRRKRKEFSDFPVRTGSLLAGNIRLAFAGAKCSKN